MKEMKGLWDPLLPREGSAYQQAIGTVDSDTAGERWWMERSLHTASGRASLFIHARLPGGGSELGTDQQLLAHVLQLHAPGVRP